MIYYDQALLDSGPSEQCPVVVGVYRCMDNRHHLGECSSLDTEDRIVYLGVSPVLSEKSHLNCVVRR